MSKKVILVSTFAAILAGTLSAVAVSYLASNENKIITLEHPTTKTSDVYFTQNTQMASLPDLTTAAQKGVDAVVYVETMARYQQSSRSQQQQRGGGYDLFDFFFGPSYREQQQQQQQQQPQSQKNSQEEGYRKLGGGSGVIISEDGYIITNNHVIDGADKIQVTTNAGDRFTATLVGTDPSTDIALLKIEASYSLPILTFGDSEVLKVGEWVLAVGNPYGLNSTVTSGIVSAKGRSLGASSSSQMSIESFIQTDAAVNPGNSGGALITTDGSLIGINTLIQSPTGSYTGYSFAVPSSIARKVVGDIREFGVVQRALLGVTMQEISNDWLEAYGKESGITERGGVYVYSVSKNSAAQAAGIKEGDVITHINSQLVDKSSTVQQIIASYRPGDKVNVTVKRDGKVKQFEVVLRNRVGKEELLSSSAVDMAKELGAELQDVSDKLKKELKIRGGAQITKINQSGLLAKSRVRAGYVITMINDTPIYSVNDLNNITDKLEYIEGVYPDGRMASFQIVQ